MQNQSSMKRGVNGLPYIDLRHPSGAKCQVYLNGAQAVSWKNAAGHELLFMSAESSFKPGSPIRGGIPVVFPQFGDGPLPKHGLARIHEWALLSVVNPVARHCVTRNPVDFQHRRTQCGATTFLSNDGYAEARFELKDNSETWKIWPYKFNLNLNFRLAAMELEITFSLGNTGQEEFAFQNGLHTYFAVADISRTSVQGLHATDFIDYVGTRKTARETRDLITFDRETDRIYLAAPDKVVLNDAGNHREIIIAKRAMNDIVIWNPWIEKSKRMEDFGDTEYKHMICVETGNLRSPVRLAPGAGHKSATIFTGRDLSPG